MRTPKISVVMPVYNAEKYISYAIESMLKQTFGDFELLIIDDCGHDHSMDIVQGYDDCRIRIFKNEFNRGIAYSRNKAIDNAEGEYIALMDDDDIAPINRFELEVKYLDGHPEIDVLGGGELHIDEKGDVVSFYDQVICNPKRIKAELLFQDVIENGSAMFRREFIKKNNIKYKDNYLGMEDYKFWTECSAAGNIANISDILLYWRENSASETRRVFREESETRKKKFAEIQVDLLKMYGFNFTKEEYRIFTDCFCEDWRNTLSRNELNIVFGLIKKMISSAEMMNLSFDHEFKQVLKRRFVQKLEYSDVWDDGKELLVSKDGI